MHSICLCNDVWGRLTSLFYHHIHFSDTIDCDKLQKSNQVWAYCVWNTARGFFLFFFFLLIDFSHPSNLREERVCFPISFSPPAIVQTMSLLEVSKGKVEICDPLSLSSMEGWAPALLPVSDANTDNARGEMATVHPGACILKLLLPAAFRWAPTA